MIVGLGVDAMIVMVMEFGLLLRQNNTKRIGLSAS